MLVFIGIALAALPILIACVRNVGILASVLILACTAVVALTALGRVDEWGIVSVPWLIALITSCAATGGREKAEKKRHAELMAKLQAAPAAPAETAVDRFIKAVPTVEAARRPVPSYDDLVRKVPKPEGPTSAWEQMHQ